MTQTEAFLNELEKMGVSLGFIAERLSPGLTGEARAASKGVWESLAGQAKNRGEIRDLVHERLRTRGRFEGKTHDIDTTLFKRLRGNPEAKATYDAAVEAKRKAMATQVAPEPPPAAAAPGKQAPKGIPRQLKTTAALALAGAGAGYVAGHDKDAMVVFPKNAMAVGFFDEMKKLAISRNMVDKAIGSRILESLKGVARKPAAAAAGAEMSAADRMFARFDVGQAQARFPKKAEMIKEAPFKSEAQRRKFYALKSKGKMDQKTIDEWESETPANIPERVKKTADDKTALEKATILSAIFNRAFKGKVMQKNVGSMANRFLQTAKSMGSEPTREGLRGMIQQVRTTGTV
jgi:hypothetical protein